MAKLSRYPRAVLANVDWGLAHRFAALVGSGSSRGSGGRSTKSQATPVIRSGSWRRVAGDVNIVAVRLRDRPAMARCHQFADLSRSLRSPMCCGSRLGSRRYTVLATARRNRWANRAWAVVTSCRRMSSRPHITQHPMVNGLSDTPCASAFSLTSANVPSLFGAARRIPAMLSAVNWLLISLPPSFWSCAFCAAAHSQWSPFVARSCEVVTPYERGRLALPATLIAAEQLTNDTSTRGSESLTWTSRRRKRCTFTITERTHSDRSTR